LSNIISKNDDYIEILSQYNIKYYVFSMRKNYWEGNWYYVLNCFSIHILHHLQNISSFIKASHIRLIIV